MANLIYLPFLEFEQRKNGYRLSVLYAFRSEGTDILQMEYFRGDIIPPEPHRFSFERMSTSPHQKYRQEALRPTGEP